MSRLLEEQEDGSPHRDKYVRRALQTALVVGYVRPFSGNDDADDVRPDLPNRAMRAFTPEERALHKVMLKRRKDESAHSDPAVASVTVRVADNSGTPLAWPVSSVMRELHPKDLRLLRSMCEKVFAYIYDEMLRIQPTLTPGERF